MAELVHSFLIPEVAKQESRNKGSDTRTCAQTMTLHWPLFSVRLAQHKYLLGAHQVVKETCAENLSESMVTERRQRSTPPADEQDEKEESVADDDEHDDD